MTTESQQLTAIFFDAGGTIVFPDPVLTLEPLRDMALPSQAQLHSAEREAKRCFDQARADGHPIDAQYWHIYYAHLFRELGITDNDDLRTELVRTTRAGTNWRRVMPDARPVLQRLKDRFKLGLISNSDGTVRQLFETLGLASYFDSFTDSFDCGVEKPDPRIFERALSTLKAKAENSLYIGDILSVDYLGATSAGMRAVLIDVAGTYRETDYPRVESLTELEDRIEEFARLECAPDPASNSRHK